MTKAVEYQLAVRHPPPAKARGFLIAQEWGCIATAHWFLLLATLLHRSLSGYSRPRTGCLVIAESEVPWTAGFYAT